VAGGLVVKYAMSRFMMAGEQGFAVRHRADSLDELAGRAGFKQKSAGARRAVRSPPPGRAHLVLRDRLGGLIYEYAQVA
jgi:hypothetical protein